MKKWFNDFKKGNTQTKLFMALTVAALSGAAGLLLFLLDKYIGAVLAAAALVFVGFYERIEDFLINGKNHIPDSCGSCLGCNYFYPRIRKTVFAAVRQCAGILPIKTPETDRIIETIIQQPADGLPRYSFKIMKLKTSDEPLDISIVKECLSEAINDKFSADAMVFAGSSIKSLYLEDIQENAFSYTFTIMPVCPGRTDKYIEKLCRREMMMQDYSEQTETIEDVYDDVF